MNAAASTAFASKTTLRWESARAQSRRCILDAAATVFAEEGFEGATMRRIAAVCGVTKVTIYAHYRDKERLYKAVMDSHLAAMASGKPDMQGTAGLGDALMRISSGIGRLAADASCRAFCASLSRSIYASEVYIEHWNAMLEPYLTCAEQAFAKASVRASNAGDGEKFLTLLLAGHGLPGGARPMAECGATVALFVRAYDAFGQ